MADLASLGFEIERRNIVFHKDTTMPDGSQLAYIGDPNDAVNGHTSGETLLYNCPSGTRYLDKTYEPYDRWVKVSDSPGGVWVKESAGGGSNSYNHVQAVSAAIWNVNHNLGKNYPSVTVVDSSFAKEEVIGQVIYIDSNNLQIKFSAPFGGEAYVI